MRVWVPSTPQLLAAHLAAGEVPAGSGRLTAAEDEESEYAALVEAAEASAALLRQRGEDGARRVVLVVEPAAGDDLDGAVPLARWRAVHADTAQGADPDDDLGWYGVQEVGALLRGEL